MLIRGQLLPIDQKDLESYPPLLAQFLLLMRTRRMQPKVIVAYDRIPYVDRRGNVRITFDKNIAASVDFSHFLRKKCRKYRCSHRENICWRSSMMSTFRRF